jgi:transcription initiation factor TFIIIB Brf1 subunit/transcription initiation factor TFIIB
VTNYAEGDVICRGCGLVVQDHIFVDDGSWVGEPINTPHASPTTELKGALMQLGLDHLYDEACNILSQVTSKYNFRGERHRVCEACCVYIAARRDRRGRDANEICTNLGVNTAAFQKALKTIYSFCPELSTQCKILTEEDTLVRQIQSIPNLDHKYTFKVARLVKELDRLRTAQRLLIATPPMIVNAVLIFVAAEKLGVGLDKQGFVSLGWLSRATLDKHAKVIKAALIKSGA